MHQWVHPRVICIYLNNIKYEIEIIITETHAFYEANGITETKNATRFNAFKVANYIRSLYGEGDPDIDKLMEIDKSFVRNDYEKRKGKTLSGAEKQVFNDIYKVYNLSEGK